MSTPVPNLEQLDTAVDAGCILSAAIIKGLTKIIRELQSELKDRNLFSEDLHA